MFTENKMLADTYTIGERHYTSIRYQMTDDLFAYLLHKGKNIVRINYGAYNGFDVIVWEE